MSSFALAKRRWQSGRTVLGRHAALIAFGLLVVLGGSNTVAVRFSNLGLPPFWGAAARFGAAALIFWAIVAARRIPLPSRRELLGSLLYGVVGVGVAYAFGYWALTRVDAGLASIFLALIPLATVLLAAAHGLEQLRGRRVAGALIAAGGIALIASGGLSSGAALPVLLALIAFPLFLAEGSVIVKITAPRSAVMTSALSLSVGSVMLATLSLLSGERWSLPSGLRTWAAFAYLVLLGSVSMFYLGLFVLGRWPASRMAFGAVLMPLVATALSVWLAGEVVSAYSVLGGLVTAAGVWLGAISHRSQAPAPRERAAPELEPCPEGADC